jgi:hypothetical protein
MHDYIAEKLDGCERYNCDVIPGVLAWLTTLGHSMLSSPIRLGEIPTTVIAPRFREGRESSNAIMY